jgi:peroxiredoxin
MVITVCVAFAFLNSEMNENHTPSVNRVISSGKTDLSFTKEKVLSGWKDRSILVLFFNQKITAQKSVLLYAQVLYQKYKDRGLGVIGVPLISDGIESLKRRTGVEFPIIADPGGSISELYKIRECCGGVVLTNRKQEIVFSDGNMLAPESLRQLVEQEILGNIRYEFEKPVR